MLWINAPDISKKVESSPPRSGCTFVESGCGLHLLLSHRFVHSTFLIRDGVI
jgi:hypothetical protein